MIPRLIPLLAVPFSLKLSRRLKTLFAVGALVLQSFACVTASAVELAGISVASSLNEPLQASISIKGVGPAASPESLVAALASADAHATAGIPFDKVLTGLIFTADLVSDPPVVLIETINPVMTPFLRFLLRVDSGGQHLLRDYTVMLDPADSATGGEAVTGELAQPRIPASALSYPGEYIGPVQQGETLMQIARRIVVAGPVTLEQTMVALVDDNPEDFIDGNMNLLREGATLHVPSERRMAAMDADGARAIYESHLLGWLQRQPEATTGESSSSNWITLSSPASQAPDPALDSKDEGSVNYVLRIVQPTMRTPGKRKIGSGTSLATLDTQGPAQEKPTTNAAASEQAVATLTDRLSAVEESLGSKELENRQLNQQVELLQQQLEKTLQLIELQETQLAVAQQQLQTMLAQESSSHEPDYTSSAESPDSDPSSKQSAMSDPAVQPISSRETPEASEDGPAIESEQQTLTPEVAQAPTPTGALPDPATSVSLDTATGVGSESAAPPPPWIEPAQTLDWLMVQGVYWIRVGGDFVQTVPQTLVEGESMVPGVPQQTLLLFAAVLALLWLLARFRRRRIPWEASEDAAVAGPTGGRSLFDEPASQTQSDSGTGEPAPPEESVGAGFVTDIETQRGVAVQSDEVDPLTESEIYLAYGRSVQAEQTLRDAISRTPDRLELKLKLLEVLNVLVRPAAFQELAAEVRGLVASGSPEEAHLEKLVRESEFAGADAGSSPEAVPEPAAIDLPDQPITGNAGIPSSEPPVTAEPDEGIVFEFDTEPQPASAALAGATVPAALASGQRPIDPAGDLELELESPLGGGSFAEVDPVNQDAEDPTPSAPADLLATVNDSAPASDKDNEEKTQLELANAYLEMGDPVAAREILTGLSLSQDPGIKERAQALLEKAGA